MDEALLMADGKEKRREEKSVVVLGLLGSATSAVKPLGKPSHNSGIKNSHIKSIDRPLQTRVFVKTGFTRLGFGRSNLNRLLLEERPFSAG